MRRTVAAVAAVAAVLLAGCVPQAPPSPTPSPTPTFMCTPEAGGTEAPCSEQEYQKMKAKDALYAEAEQVYRTYQAEYAKVIRKGGSTTLSPGLKATIGSPEVSASVLRGLRYFHDNGLRLKGEASVIASAAREPSRDRGGSVVAMTFCVDGRKTTVFKGSKRQGSGIVGIDTVYFALRDGSLRMASVDSKVVSSCGV